MSFMIGDKKTDLKYPDDFVASAARLQSEIKIDNSDVVFVGYGIVAPEYGWDDYKDFNVSGKTILILIGDPPVPDLKDASKLDDKMFKGKAMTYYGRWTYKYEIATTKEFRPVALNAKANIEIKQTLRVFKSRNVIGKLDGSDPKLQNEYVIYTAHWDHLGRHPELQGDQILNGAIDNASGVASLIQLAAAFTKLNPPPKRSVLFMATTAEEAGLLGAKFYAQHP